MLHSVGKSHLKLLMGGIGLSKAKELAVVQSFRREHRELQESAKALTLA